MFAAAATSDASLAANSEAAVADCQTAVDGLCLDDGKRLIGRVVS